MDPPVKSRLRGLGGLLASYASGALTFRIKPLRSIDPGVASRSSVVTCLWVSHQLAFAPNWGKVSRLCHVLSPPAASPGLRRRKARARTLRSPLASVTQPCFCRPCPFSRSAALFLLLWSACVGLKRPGQGAGISPWTSQQATHGSGE